MNKIRGDFMVVQVDGITQLRRYSIDVSESPHRYIPNTSYTEEIFWLASGGCHIVTDFRPDDLDYGMEQCYEDVSDEVR